MNFDGERVIPNQTPERIFEDHLERYKFASKFVQHKKVADIACGSGYGANIYKKNNAKSICGLDISKEAIQYAQTNYPNIDFLVGNATNLPYSNNCFDVVTSFETIEHLEDYETFLNEINRVLAKKGLLILSSPNRIVTSPNKKIDENPDNKFHHHEFTEEELLELLGYNFDNIKIYGQRNINSYYLNPFVRKLISKTSNIFNLKLKDKIYKYGTGPQVEKSKTKISRYIIIVCEKK